MRSRLLDIVDSSYILDLIIMSQVPHSLPLIDISPFIFPTTTLQSRTKCTTLLSQACLHHGFFYLVNHGISTSLTDRVLALARSFFTECADTEKLLIKRQDVGKGVGDGARGYQVIGDNVTQGKRDWHEAVDWYRPVIPGEALTGHGLKMGQKFATNGSQCDEASVRLPPYILLHGINLWPDRPTEFQEVYSIYIEKMLELGTAVVRAMGHALELRDPETFVTATRESFWVMRAIGYPSLPSNDMTRNGADKSRNEIRTETNEEGVSCGAHTDYGCLTLLLADSTVGALQVQSRCQPEEWINADPMEGAFVVNIGDMMERWTNGLWKSTMHRVVHRGDGFRVSVPFFFEPDFQAVVRPLEECVKRTGGKERWEAVQYGHHLIGKVGGNFYGGVEKESLDV